MSVNSGVRLLLSDHLLLVLLTHSVRVCVKSLEHRWLQLVSFRLVRADLRRAGWKAKSYVRSE